MPYTLENCTLYSKTSIKSKPVYIFDDHNMALPVWGTYSSLYGPLHLFTFDTHTDTQPAFQKLMYENHKTVSFDYKEMLSNPVVKDKLKQLHYKQDDFCFEDVFRYSYSIFNWEQILTGIAFGYLSSYTVRCHQKRAHLTEQYETSDQEFGYDATYIGDDDERSPIIRNPLILDIDLDYFREPQELDPLFMKLVEPLFNNAVAITIAREPDYFLNGRFDEHFTVEEAESQLLALLRML